MIFSLGDLAAIAMFGSDELQDSAVAALSTAGALSDAAAATRSFC